MQNTRKILYSAGKPRSSSKFFSFLECYLSPNLILNIPLQPRMTVNRLAWYIYISVYPHIDTAVEFTFGLRVRSGKYVTLYYPASDESWVRACKFSSTCCTNLVLSLNQHQSIPCTVFYKKSLVKCLIKSLRSPRSCHCCFSEKFLQNKITPWTESPNSSFEYIVFHWYII